METEPHTSTAPVHVHTSSTYFMHTTGQSCDCTHTWRRLRLLAHLFALVFQPRESNLQRRSPLPLTTVDEHRCARTPHMDYSSLTRSHSLVRLQPVSPGALPPVVQAAVWRAASQQRGAAAPESAATIGGILQVAA
mmetsp:Transcript_36389/g.60305  ORF Transcript_36389/g.60305 Transcript_36389/m.60305 type:complete len:136 (+) Transcript_36389:30-437(+)